MPARHPAAARDPLEPFELTDDQRAAATELSRDVLLTAGAGTGKTRTLVARYVHLLSRGLSVRQIVAITFTEKAAREMRNRIRRAVGDLAAASEGEARARWLEVETRMDAARVGTIHSLCAEILRAHPAEAQLDPGFEVVDEGLGLTFKARAAAEALAWAAGDPQAAELFRAFTTGRLAAVLARLLEQRLEAGELLAEKPPAEGGGRPGTEGSPSAGAGRPAEVVSPAAGRLQEELDSFLGHAGVEDAIGSLRALQADGALQADAGTSLGPRAELLLEVWAEIAAARAAGDLFAACSTLYRLRRECLIRKGGGAASRARAAVDRLQELYDERLNPWIGGAKSEDPPPEPAAEAAWAAQRPRLAALFERALAAYRVALEARRALDFDDLEAGALALLQDPAVRSAWREKLQAVLVDEFQDTNERQRRIIDALVGERPGCLFAVGDARQSIYRFRGADVRVFRRKRQEIQSGGGFTPEIELSFRAHAPLLSALDDLVGPIMGRDDGGELFRVPYTPLTAERAAPAASGAGPHLEFVLGSGGGAREARAAAARALTRRLAELRQEGVVQDWSGVALLFRASAGFEAYENALEEAGIPFVTVAGRGFYERPEIRDLVNALRAIADPSDDLAVAGLLRSPAVGLSDPGLFRLRVEGTELRPLGTALARASEILEGPDLDRAHLALALIEELHPLADRLPVAELLSRLIGRQDWRAVLASSHSRLWRNLDKLVEDAQASGLVHVGAFLEYLTVLRDVGVREGEAPAGEGGALQLMTIHKAKGLEFDLVVLADASRTAPQRAQPVYLVEEIGAAAVMDRLEGEPLAYRLAKALEAEQSRAEENRLLYVAATRARERLIVSGHLSLTQDSWRASGWLKEMLDLTGLDPATLAEAAGREAQVALPGGQPLRAWTAGELEPLEPVGKSAVSWPESRERPLFGEIPGVRRETLDPDLAQEPEHAWRATGGGRHAPAAAVGGMVHAAIQRGAMPGSQGFERFLEQEAFDAGLIDRRQRRAAIRESGKLLERLAAHPFWAEIGAAQEVYREIPFVVEGPDRLIRGGRIDLLWRGPEGWKLVDFKTDTLRDEAELQAAVAKHRKQVEPYVRSAASILGETPLGMLCFLDAEGEVKLVEI